MMPKPVLRLVNTDGSIGAVLDGWTSLEIGGDDGSPRALILSYTIDHPTHVLLADEAVVVVLVDGVELPRMRFTLDSVTSDEVEDETVSNWNGRGTLGELEYAVTYPTSWPTLTAKGHGWTNRSAGNALRELLEAAQARGALTGLTWDFTDALDSGGQAWVGTTSETVLTGTTYLTVVENWAARKFAVASSSGNVLQLFNYGNQGDDKSNDIALIWGTDLSEGPVSISTRNTISTILAATEEFGVERTDNPALTRWGRREGFLSQQSVPDTTTLQAIADGTLALKARSRDSFTYGLTFANHLPLLDFDTGDQVQLRVRDGETRFMRVRQLTVKWDQDGEAEGSASFGDKRMESDEQLARRLEQLTNGSMDAGVVGQPIIGEPKPSSGSGGSGNPDTIPPSPVTALNLVSSSVAFNAGRLRATAVIGWTAPTTQSNGTPLEDLGSYQVQYRMFNWPTWTDGGRYAKDETEIAISNLIPGDDYDVRVRAIDIYGNVSTWASLTFETAVDNTVPVTVPSVPIVSTFLYDSLLVEWDGLSSTGGAVDNDTRHVEVHVSTVTGFTPDATTLQGTIEVPGGETVVSGLNAGTTYFVKLRIVDWAGNIGPVSAQASGVPVSVFSDIPAGTLGPEKLTWNDTGNLFPDGSFERADFRAYIDSKQWVQKSVTAAEPLVWTTSTQDTWVQSAEGAHGTWVARLRYAADATWVRIKVAELRSTGGSEQHYARGWFRANTVTNQPTAFLCARYLDAAGAEITTGVLFPLKSSGWVANTWVAIEGIIKKGTANVAQHPNIRTIELYIAVTGLVSGQYIDADAIEFREVITSLRVADLAVTNAKIADLSASKITAGTLSAVVTISGTIRTASTGARVNIDSTGIKLYDSAGDVTVNLNATTGEGTFNGVLGSMKVSGYVQVANALVSPGQILLWYDSGGKPIIALSTGQTYEYYYGRMFPTNIGLGFGSSPHQLNLTFQLHAPGWKWVSGEVGAAMFSLNTTTDYYTGGGMLVDNMFGQAKFLIPNHVPSATYNEWEFSSPYTSSSTHDHLPAMILRDGRNHEAAWRLENLGSAAENTRMRCLMRDGTGTVVSGTSQSIHVEGSSEHIKEDIQKVPYSALEVIRGNPAKKWKFKKTYGPQDKYQIGPMAEGLPEELLASGRDERDLAIVQQSMSGLMWHGIRELDDKLESLITALQEAVPSLKLKAPEK